MRQVFTSLRLENVEGVAALLNEHGIETRITEGRSYKGGRRRSFSFRENEKEQPPQAAVWVVKSEDQPRARALLREAGLMDSTRESYLPEGAQPEPVRHSPTNTAARIRLALLASVVILATLTTARGCKKPDPAPATPVPASEPVPESDSERHIVPVDVSLD